MDFEELKKSLVSAIDLADRIMLIIKDEKDFDILVAAALIHTAKLFKHDIPPSEALEGMRALALLYVSRELDVLNKFFDGLVLSKEDQQIRRAADTGRMAKPATA